MNAHSLWSASSAYRWMTCPGSLALIKDLPPKNSGPAALRGTAGHEIAARCLNDPTDMTNPDEFTGVEVTENDGSTFMHPVDNDLCNQVTEYVEYIRSFSGTRLVEVRVYYGKVLDLPEEDAYGTSDAIIFTEDVLDVIDLKTGRHWVGAKNNKQLLLYAIGGFDIVKLLEPDIKTIRLHIVQPSVHQEPDVWELSVKDFMLEVESLRSMAVESKKALEDFTSLTDQSWVDEYLHPSEDACEYCPARVFCPKLNDEVDEAMPSNLDEFELSNLLEAYPMEKLNEAINRIGLLNLWIEAVQEEMYRRVKRGDTGANRKLVQGRQGNRAWDGTQEELEEKIKDKLIEAEGLETASALILSGFLEAPATLKTPSALEKDLKREGIRIDLSDLTVRSEGKLALVTLDNPKEPWIPPTSTDDFQSIYES